jgi:peptidoglycan lytic transglycosylase
LPWLIITRFLAHIFETPSAKFRSARARNESAYCEFRVNGFHMMLRRAAALLACLLLGWPLLAQEAAARSKSAAHASAARGAQVGVASVYSKKLTGRKTASGKTFKPDALTAASRKLPLNSKAKVTNLKTGQSTDVTITDRGPYKKDRVIDLSPAAADRIGVEHKEGLAPVEVKPITPAEPNSAIAETPNP